METSALFLSECVEPWGSVAARRIPADCRSKLSVRTLRSPNRGKRSAESRGRGTPHPLARLTIGPVPPAGGNCRSMTRTGAPLGAPLRRFSFDLETAFWKRTGAAIRNALDPAGFSPCVHPLPPARCRTDPCSWAGRCLPRPPEARLARPNPQAPPPLRQQAPPVGALCEQGWIKYRRGG